MTILALFLAAAAAAAPAPSPPPEAPGPTPAEVRRDVAAGRFDAALAEAWSVRAAHPDDRDAVTALGEALYGVGRIDEAADLLAPLVAAADPPGRALAQLGLARAAQGREAEAGTLLQRAARRSPDDRWVLFNAAGGASTRAGAVALLEAYLKRSEGDDPDRIEAAKGTIRLYKMLGERKIWVPDARPDHVEIRLHPLVGQDLRGGWVIDATLPNGKRARLLLDTGSTGLFVVWRKVKKAGYTALSDLTVFAGGGKGRTKSARGILPSIDFGGVSFKDALVTTTKNEFDRQGRFHGVVGLSVFAGYRATIDLARGRLVLDKIDGGSNGEPYWNVSGQLLVRARAEGAPAGLFLLDTGATISNVDKDYAKGIPGAEVFSGASIRTYGGIIPDASYLRGVTLTFGGLATSGQLVHGVDLSQRSRLGGVAVAGYLGMDLLDGKVLVVDTSAHRVSLSEPKKR